MTAALPMGSQKITGMAEPTVSTDAATKNYVDTTTAAFFSTGDVKMTIKTAADSGWVLCNDGTIGNAGSGSSNRANADCLALFTLIFNSTADADCALLTSGGGATTRVAQTNAATAWAANCRITLPGMQGRVLGVYGTGPALSTRALAQKVGAETVAIAQSGLPNVTLAVGSISVTSTVSNVVTGTVINPVFNVTGASAFNVLTSGTGGASSITSTGTGTSASINGNVAQTATSIMQPTSFINAMMKL